MLALKFPNELNWGDLCYIEDPMHAMQTVEREHGKRINGQNIQNAHRHDLPSNSGTRFNAYGSIRNQLENGQVFLVNRSTLAPAITSLEIDVDGNPEYTLRHSTSQYFQSAFRSALRHIPVPKPMGVLRDEPKPAQAKEEQTKLEQEKHIIVLKIDSDINKPLPSKYPITLCIENNSKGVMVSRKRVDVIFDQFSSVFKLDAGETIKIFAIPDFLDEVRLDLKENKNVAKSESNGLIAPLKEVSRETRSDGVIIHTIEYDLQKIEVVDVIHVTGKNEFILLTQQCLKEIEDEEKIIQDSMQLLRDELAKGARTLEDSELKAEESEGVVTSPIQEAKVKSIEKLKELGVFDKNVSLPTKLTEIKRLNGQHRTWIRSDKIKNHWKRYKMDSKDRERSKGWYQDNKIDGQKLKEAIAADFNVKFKTDFFKYESDENNPLNQFHKEYKASFDELNPNMKDRVGFDASAEAQFMRFASVAGAAAEMNLKEGKVAIQAQAAASFDLAKGEIKAEQVFPVNSRSKILVPYIVNTNGKRESRDIDLGHLQAKIEASLSGTAGASVLLAANVAVDCSDGLPKIKGKQMGADGKAEAFAGVRGGCGVKGSLSWTDVLTKNSDWKQLCGIGKKVEGAVGVGIDGGFTFGYNTDTGKFLLRAHAGLVIGVGAAGSFELEVDPAATLTMVHFMYEGLRGVDYRKVKLFDENGFKGYTNLCLYMLTHKIQQWGVVIESGVDLSMRLKEYFDGLKSDYEKEEKAFELAQNIIESSQQGENSVLLHSPPEAKGRLLSLLIFDPFGIWDNLSSDDEVKRKAIIVILQSIQGEREYNEIMVRMNETGKAENNFKDRNARKVFDTLGLGEDQQQKFEKRIFNKVPQTGMPVQLDPLGACQACGIA